MIHVGKEILYYIEKSTGKFKSIVISQKPQNFPVAL